MPEIHEGVWRHWKGHLHQVLFTVALLPAAPGDLRLHLFDAACSTNGTDGGRTLDVAVRLARPDVFHTVAYPASGFWEPPSREGVAYIGLTLDGDPTPGLRPRVRDLGEFTGTVDVGTGWLPRFEYLGAELTAGILADYRAAAGLREGPGTGRAGGIGAAPGRATARIAELKAKRPKQSRVITVRLPREQHERLRQLAVSNKCSLNQLCVAAMQEAEAELGGAT